MAKPRLLIFGCGYLGRTLARMVRHAGGQVAGTSRRPHAHEWSGEWPVFRFDAVHGLEPEGVRWLEGASHVLLSIPPDPVEGDPVLAAIRGLQPLTGGGRPLWLGYLSTTGVYGDHGGRWVDETAPPAPRTARARARLAAEMAWGDFARVYRHRLTVFRLPGIYGPGRSAIDRLRAGTARCIDAGPKSVFSRIHVGDLAAALMAAMSDREPPSVGLFNLADDEPAPQHEVVAHAARLLGLPPPPLESLDEADLSEMARSFHRESRRVSAARFKRCHHWKWRYPSYREGLAAIAACAPASGGR